jgi:prophage tail gpP-like protein
MNNIVLKIRENTYEGWTSIRVEKSLLNLAGSFSFAGTDIFPGEPRKWNFSMGDSCVIEIDDQVVMTGYIEDIDITYSENSHNIQISGRSKTADLIDCSWIEDVNEWKQQNIGTIIAALCEPFDIEIVIENSAFSGAVTVLDTFKANEGDIVFDLISKLCKSVAILPIDNGDGKLTLTQAGTKLASDSLVLGDNIKTGTLRQSNKDRFSTYVVKGQDSDDPFKELFSIANPVGTAFDTVVVRNRPMVILLETKGDAGKCQKRAEWERNIRAGNSRFIQYTVQGWTQKNGDVWPLNYLVQTKDDFLGSNTTLLIANLAISLEEGSGSLTEISLIHPDSLSITVEPLEIKSEFDWFN